MYVMYEQHHCMKVGSIPYDRGRAGAGHLPVLTGILLLIEDGVLISQASIHNSYQYMDFLAE